MKKLIYLVIMLLAVGVSGAEISIENDFLSVRVDEDTKVFSIKGKVGKALVSDGKILRAIESVFDKRAKDKVFGKGRKILFKHVDGSETTMALYKKSPFVHIQMSVHNPGKDNLDMPSLDILDMKVSVGDKALKSFGTAGLSDLNGAKGSYTFHAFADPDTRNGVVSGWLTHDVGVGAFLPRAQEGAMVKAKQDYGTFRVKGGKTRDADVLLIGCFDDARLGLEAYADAVAAHYKIKIKPKPGVYCTWYHARASNEKLVGENAEFAEKNLKPFGLDVIQIDDGWQTILPKGFEHKGRIPTTGPKKVFVDSGGNYSKGMASMAEEITSHGLVAGIWFMPFAGNLKNPYFDHDVFAKNQDGTPFHDKRWSGTCVDSTSPKGKKFIYDRTKRIYDWGYRYFKIDGMHTGLATENVYIHTAYKSQDLSAKLHDPDKTLIQAYRTGLDILRKAAPEAFILGCNVSQNMLSMGPAFDKIDAMRIGPDNDAAAGGAWSEVVKGAWHGTTLYFLNGRVWHNDPDPVYVRGKNPEEKARWMCSWMAVAGALHTSSMQYSDLSPFRLDILKRCLPSHNLPARPVDLFETSKPRIWLVQNKRMSLVGLFNWTGNQEETITYDMKKLGLDPEKEYLVFDYWLNRYLPSVKGTLEQTLDEASCRILALKPVSDRPQLLSTSRHITQGLMDVVEEKWDEEKSILSGKSRVVADDSYELRVALPQGWAPETVSAGDEKIVIGEQDKNGVRLTIFPEKSGIVEWQVTF